MSDDLRQSASAKPVPILPDKNTPLVRTVGFEVKGEEAKGNEPEERKQSEEPDQTSTTKENAPAPAKVKTYITDYDIRETLGEGSFGAVVSAVHKDTKQECAIKILNKAHIVKEKKEKYVKMERDVFAMCNHRNIVQLYKTFSSPENLYYVLECCPNGELLAHIKKHGSFDLISATWYTGEIINGLEHLHQLGIVHRDLKPENVLMSDDMHVKLTDFGTAKLLEGEVKTNPDGRQRTDSFVGTAEYIAPEMLHSHETCRASDFFALGSIVYQLVTGRPPFKAKTEYLTIEKVKSLDYTFPDGFPDVPMALVKELLTKDPAERLGAGVDGYSRLRAHAMFATLEWSTMETATPPPISASGLKERIDAAERLAAGHGDDVGRNSSSNSNAADVPALTFLSQSEHDKWKSFLLADEKIIKSGLVHKYKGISVKKRQLLLTNKPRILYLSLAKQVVKGEIPWSPTIYAGAKNATSFWIQTPERKYILQDKDSKDAEGWVKAIEQLKEYLKTQK